MTNQNTNLRANETSVQTERKTAAAATEVSSMAKEKNPPSGLDGKSRFSVLKMVMLAMLVAVGVVISPILRVESPFGNMCPMAHLINIVCSVLLGPWYSLLCATLIGILRMLLMGIPPLALTGAVFGAFLSGLFYRLSGGKLFCAVLGEIFGTGILGAVASYPVMAFLWGKTDLTWLFYVPSFLTGTLIGGSISYVFLRSLRHAGLLSKFQKVLGACVYDNPNKGESKSE